MILSLLLDSLLEISPAAALGLLFCLLVHTDSLQYDFSTRHVKGLHKSAPLITNSGGRFLPTMKNLGCVEDLSDMATSRARYPPMDSGKGRADRAGKKRKKLLNSSTDASLRNPTPGRCRLPVLSTATGLLNMLKEQHPILKLHALNNLNVFMEHFWPEISAEITQIEALYEDEHFEHRHLAALVASKVFFHLGELREALTYALGAASLFNVADGSQYVQTLVAKCVDEYISINLRLEKGEDGLSLDPRLVAVMDRVLDQCLLDGRSEQAVGIALECRRLDKLEEAITRGPNAGNKLTYCLTLSQTFVSCREFRHEVLHLLVKSYKKLGETGRAGLFEPMPMLLWQLVAHE